MSTLADEISQWLDRLVSAGQHYPDIMCLLVASLVGFSLTAALERYFLPQSAEPNVLRAQQGVTFLFCWAVSAIAAALLWAAVEIALADPHPDPARVRWTVSAVVEAPCFLAYPFLARIATAIWPKIGTAWAKVAPP